MRSLPMTNSEWVRLHILRKQSHDICAITNSEWVMLHILWKAVPWHLFPWPPASQCHYCEKGSLMRSFPMTNSLWVTSHILWKAISHQICSYEQRVSDITHFVKRSPITAFLMTDRKWANMTYFVKSSLMTSPITISLLVTLHIL